MWCRYLGVHQSCSGTGQHQGGGQRSVPRHEQQGRAVRIGKDAALLTRLHSHVVPSENKCHYTCTVLQCSLMSRWWLGCLLAVGGAVSTVKLVFYWLASVCRRSCQQRASSGSSLRKTGTTHTPPTSTGTERKGPFTLLRWTKTGHPGMEPGPGDTRGSLTSCPDP